MNETIDWDDLRLFLSVARAGGLADASAVVGKSPPTLGRRMVALERTLSRDLFRRHARGYDLTEEGARLLADVSEIEARIAPLSAQRGAGRALIVKISAGTWMTRVLCRHIMHIASGDVRLRFISAEHALDIRHREAVIGIRNRRPEQPGLAGRKVGRVEFAVYARCEDVETWARTTNNNPSSVWLGEHIGEAHCVEVNSPQNGLDLAIAGACKIVLPTFIGDTCLEIRRMSNVIEELSHDQWLVCHAEERFEPPVRAVIARIGDVLVNVHRGRPYRRKS